MLKEVIPESVEATTPEAVVLPEPAAEPRYASFRDRMMATFIDLAMLAMLIGALMGGSMSSSVIKKVSPEVEKALNQRVIALNKEFQAGELTYFQHKIAIFGVARELLDGKRWFWNTLAQTIFMGTVMVLFWHYKGATPGKMFMKLKIVRVDDLGQPSNWQFIVRFIGYTISTIPLGLGYVWILFHKKRQGWHDIMSKTVVIHTRPFDPEWQKKRFKRQTILALVLVFGYVVYFRVVSQ